MTSTSQTTAPEGSSPNSCNSCSPDPSKILNRAKEVFLRPKEVWANIYAEELTLKQILVEYYLPAVLLASICSFIGSVVIGTSFPIVGTIRAEVFPSIIHLIARVGLSALYIWLGAKIVSFLSTKFGGNVSEINAAKALAFSFLPVALAGVFNLIPLLGFVTFFVGIYSLYILYCSFSSLPEASTARTTGLYLTSLVSLLITFMIVGAIAFGVLPQQYDQRKTVQSLTNGLSEKFKGIDQEKAQSFLKQMQAIGEAAQRQQEQGAN